MEYRFATPADRPTVQRLVDAYVKESRLSGNTLQHTTNNINSFMQLYDSYRRGTLLGYTVLAVEGTEVVGFAMGGETWDQGTDSDMGRIAYVWVVFVLPHHRKAEVALSMLQYGLPVLIEEGFDSVVTNVRSDNPAGARLAESYGAKAVETVYLFQLPKED